MSCLQIRRVDPTLDMEADQGDDYSHLPVCFLVLCVILYFKSSVIYLGGSSMLTGHILHSSALPEFG